MAKMEPVKAEVVFDVDNIVEQLGRFAEAAKVVSDALARAVAIVSREDAKPEPAKTEAWESVHGTVSFTGNLTAVQIVLPDLVRKVCVYIPSSQPGNVRNMAVYYREKSGEFFVRETKHGWLIGERKVCEFQVLGSRALPATMKIIDE